MKNNRKILVSSMIMIISCCLLFAGTTFAWFSDSVSSNNNIIAAGNLDVEMYWADGTVNPETTSWTDASTGPIFDYDKWEPGYVVARHIKISNVGSLALKYKLVISANGEVSDLANVIDVYYVDPAVELTSRNDLDSNHKIGTLKQVLDNLDNTGLGTLSAGDSDVITLVLKMQESAGNEYQGKSVGSSFSVKLFATQLNAEEDSFGDDFDEEAPYAIPVNTIEDLYNAIGNDGARVCLTSDITIPASFGSNAVGYVGDNSFSIDLNGHTLTSQTDNGLFRFRNEGSKENVIEISNGTLDIEKSWCSVIATGITAPITVNLDNLTINESKDNSQTIKAFSGATINMTNCTINTSFGGGVMADGGTVNIYGDGNTFTQTQVSSWANYNSNNMSVCNDGVVNVYGGNFKSDYYSVIIMSSGGTINIYGGNFSTTHSNNHVVEAGVDGVYNAGYADAVLNVYGGNFDNANTPAENDGSLNVWDWTPTDSVNTYVNIYSEANYGSVLNNYNAAKVNYITAVSSQEELVEALNNNNGTVKFTNDITLEKAIEIPAGVTNVTIDLNGNTIASSNGEYVVENNNGATLVISDSSSNASAFAMGNNNAKNGEIKGVVYNGEGSTLIIENGTFTAADGEKYVLLNSAGTLIINGGVVNGGSSYPIYSYNSGAKLVINDVTVNATFGCVNAYGTDSEVEINGGTYYMTGVSGKTSHIAYFSNADVVINGGNFNKVGDINMSASGGGGICAIYGANLTINGGNFAGDYADLYNWGGTNANGRSVKINVNGGNFKFNPNSFVTAGHQVVQNANGYTVE